MKTGIFLFLLAAFMGGCASSQKIIGPDGNTAYAIECSDEGLTWNDCLAEAGKVCPSGYTILRENKESGNAFRADKYGISLRPVQSREMLVQCK